MHCSNCGFKLAKIHHYCPNCGLPVGGPGLGVPSVGRRIAMVIYVLAYVALAAASVGVGLTIYKSFATPDPGASLVTCRSGTKLSYRSLGIRNPLTDANHDNLVIDVACRNLGGNTYTNVVRTGWRATVWEYGLAVLAGGLVVIEVIKGTLTYLLTGRWPSFGSLGRR